MFFDADVSMVHLLYAYFLLLCICITQEEKEEKLWFLF